MPTDSPDLASSPQATDASLLRRLWSGETDAATELYRRYAGRLLTLAENQTSPAVRARLDAEDIVQSVFRTFFRRAVNGEYVLPDGDELWKLFLVIGLNKVRAVAGHHKAAKRDARRTTGGLEFDDAVAATAAVDEQAMTTLRLTIDEILASLPESYRAVIDLRVAGFEVADIATRVGRAKRSVERILQEFRATLHRMIHESR